jgi:hypothetical protein
LKSLPNDDPLEAPAHAALEFLDLRQRRPRHDDKGDVALPEVDRGAVEMIGKQRTAWAALLPAGAEHEVINDQLTLAAEQIGQGLFARRRIEHIISVHLFPRQLAALLAQGVACPGKSLFLGEVGLARRDPFIVADDPVRFHLRLHVLPPCGLFRRRHPADAGAAGLEQHGDAADAGNVERLLHHRGAGFDSLLRR